MNHHDLTHWRHEHFFTIAGEAERRQATLLVAVLSFITMLVELGAGYFTGSMALIADAWHMASHVAALGIAWFAYHFSARHAHDSRFTFGTGKVGTLGGYTSALLLMMVALMMAAESIARLRQPIAIRYDEALVVAGLGLAINLISAWLLRLGHDHHDDDDHHNHHHHDHNLRGAFLHVLADALTSVLAIIALLAGKHWGWINLDPMMGLVGAAVILPWAIRLARSTTRILLDAEEPADEMVTMIHQTFAREPDVRVVDLHVWRIGPQARACIISLVSHAPQPVEIYKALLTDLPNLEHITVEIHRCPIAGCAFN